MPIEKQFNFQNEADFISRFLVPLLRRLGYSIVAEYHGKREFGKDLVFGEIDRFGEVAYHGLQAKYQDSISQSDSEELIDDCRQAFRNSFRHPNTGAEHRIGTFVVANAGSITDNARENFFGAAMNSERGANVRIFDGKALLALDRWATVSQLQQVGDMLSGLLIEIQFNHRTLPIIRKRVQDKVSGDVPLTPAERLRTNAVSHYLLRPMMRNHISVSDVTSYWVLSERGINGMLDHWASGGLAKDALVSMGEEIIRHIDEVQAAGKRLETSVSAAIREFGPLAASI